MRHALIPMRDFDGMTRLIPAFEPTKRRDFSIALANRVLGACQAAELTVMIVTSDGDVEAWARASGVATLVDPGRGLSAAVTGAVAAIGDDPWLVIHADLPTVNAEAIRLMGRGFDEAGTAIAPSLDGGTNAIASEGTFRFSFGPGSFHRHLAHRPDAAVVVDARLAIELDTPGHAQALRTLALLPSLTP